MKTSILFYCALRMMPNLFFKPTKKSFFIRLKLVRQSWGSVKNESVNILSMYSFQTLFSQ